MRFRFTAVALLCASLSASATSFNFAARGFAPRAAGKAPITAAFDAPAAPVPPEAFVVPGNPGADALNLIGLGGHSGNESLIYPTSSDLFDRFGFAFIDPTGGDQFKVNALEKGDGTFAQLTDQDDAAANTPILSALSAAAPEPSGLVLLPTGLAVIAALAALAARTGRTGRTGAMRRRSSAA